MSVPSRVQCVGTGGHLAAVVLALPEGVTAALASGAGERRRPWRAAAALASGGPGERRVGSVTAAIAGAVELAGMLVVELKRGG